MSCKTELDLPEGRLRSRFVDQTGINDVSTCSNTRVFRLGSRSKRIVFLRSLLLLKSSELSKIDEQIALLTVSLHEQMTTPDKSVMGSEDATPNCDSAGRSEID